MPAFVRGSAGVALVFNDASGTVTCLMPGGKVAWTNALAAAPCKAPPQAVSLKLGEDSVLIPAGATLFCYDPAGGIRWRRDLDKEIVTRPEVLSLADRRLIVCGTASGALVALDLRGRLSGNVPPEIRSAIGLSSCRVPPPSR